MTDKDARTTERLLPAGGLEVKEAHVVVVDGDQAGQEVPCGARTVRIGSGFKNELVLGDGAVSAEHAVLESTPAGLVLRDLGSTNGTTVDGVRIREVYVQPGSTIQVGRTTLRVELRTRREDIPPSRGTSFGRLVGKSAKMRQLFGMLEWVAPTEASLLITGPSGTGKEMVALSVHENSPRKNGPFVVLDCGAVDSALISSELFGHEAGAFTGAAGRRAGVFEEARGGTVFLDEVGELALELQPKLLRVLDSRELRRLGGNQSIKVDVRLIAATNRPLEQMVGEGKFREDLYYRLCQLQVALPTLDERREDIPLLVASMLERIAAPGPPRTMAQDALALLWSGVYPGNVRQLRNIVERAAMVARGPQIERSHLMLQARELAPRTGGAPAARAASPEDAERERIVSALAANGGLLARTAKSLGIALNTLKSRMRKMGIPFPRPSSRDS